MADNNATLPTRLVDAIADCTVQPRGPVKTFHRA